MSAPVDIFLVRHGEVVGKEARKKLNQIREGQFVPNFPLSAGLPPDNGLTSEGESQAASINAWLRKTAPHTFDQVLAAREKHSFWMCEEIAGNTRTHETARKLDLPASVWRKTPLLNDRLWGTLGDSITRRQLRQLQKDAPDPYTWKPPGGGSSTADLVVRAKEFLAHLEREPGYRSIVVSCHGEVLIAIAVAIRELDNSSFASLLRKGEFDMPDGVICQFSRFDPTYLQQYERLAWERLVCPWDLSRSRNDGRWRQIC